MRIDRLEFWYGRKEFLLNIPMLNIKKGKKVAIVGPSGCGKTTLIHLIAGILRAPAGLIEVNNIILSEYSERDLNDFRIITMGLIFQEFKLLEYLKVEENILLPYRLNSVLPFQPEIRSRARELARRVGLEDKLDRYPNKLSQGERQRVALCRALITRPSLLLCDEPTANLDPVNRDKILEMLFQYCMESQATLIMVSHDTEILQKFDDVIDIRQLQSASKTDAA